MSKRDALEKEAGVLFNAYNMEERCRVIEQLGGTFYADPKDCVELNWNGQAGGSHSHDVEL